MEIKTFVYPYGAFYDVDFSESRGTSSGIVVYNNVRCIQRVISSLEGFFVSVEPLDWNRIGNPVCRRDEMIDFGEKYHGKFVPFTNSIETQ